MNPVNSFVMTSLPKPLLLLCTLPLVNFSFPFFLAMPRGIFVPRPETKPRPLAVKACSPNHWKAREFPISLFFFF